jgi:hypothetical protein
MWCIECEQEVIVTGKSDRAPPVCPNCQSQLLPGIALRDVPPADQRVDDAAQVADHAADTSMNSGPEPAIVPNDPSEFPAMPAMHWDDWQLDTDADRIQMLLNQFDALSGPQALPERSPSRSAQPASGQPATGTPTLSNEPISTPPRAAVSTARPKSSRSPWPAWLVLSTGLMLFVCGTILAGWSLITMRSELWLTGVPVSLVGIACLLVGFVLQLESLWTGHRETMKMLLELDDRMAEIRHATTLLKTSHSGAAQSFYANLADGANPQVLLADLKGQLDLLAQQMARENRRAA